MVRFVSNYELGFIITSLNEAHRKLKKASNHKKEAQKRMHKIKARNANRFKKMKKDCCIDEERRQVLLKNTQAVIDEYNYAYETLCTAIKNHELLKLRLVIAAGVPKKFHSNYAIHRLCQGSISIFFGGRNGPFDERHGHYVITDDGIMTYRREYGEEHGPHHHCPEGHLIYADCGDAI